MQCLVDLTISPAAPEVEYLIWSTLEKENCYLQRGLFEAKYKVLHIDVYQISDT